MADLRWALLLLGTVFLAGLGLWEWRRGRRRRGVAPVVSPPHEAAAIGDANDTEPLLRREPVMGDFSPTIGALPAVDLAVPGIRPGDSMRIGIAAEEAVDVPAGSIGATAPMPAPASTPEPSTTGAPVPGFDPAAPLDFSFDAGMAEDAAAGSEAADASGRTTVEVAEMPRPLRPEDTQVATDVADAPPPIRWPPAQLPDRVLGLRVASPAGRPLPGQQVRLALLAAGLRHGPQQIFHRTDDDGNVLASVANLLRPGSLLPERMDGQEFRGLSLFSVLPGAQPDEDLLEGLVMLSRALASRLGAVVQDEYGQELDAERLAQLRRAVSSSSAAGDGAGM